MNITLPKVLTFRPSDEVRGGLLNAKRDGRMTTWLLNRGLRRELTEMGYIKPRRPRRLLAASGVHQSQGEHKLSS